jgi:DNA invertase Pin-like site-specific DNA recombinase
LINAGTGQDVTKDFEDDPMKTALIQMQGVFAQLEKNLLVKKLRKAREAKRKAGKCEGRKRYGEIDPQEQHVIKRIVALRRKPKGLGKRRTYQQIADILNAEGIKTQDGKQWQTAQVWRIVNRKKAKRV